MKGGGPGACVRLERKAGRTYGLLLGIFGFVVLMIGIEMLRGAIATSELVTTSAVIAGLALLVGGSGLFGFNWADGFSNLPRLNDVEKWSIVATFIVTVTVCVMAFWNYMAGSVIWTAVSVGALGGLVHEISQSGGTAFLPGTGQPKHDTGKAHALAPGAAGAGGGDGASGESYLGGLVGIILGGAAGLLVLSTSYSFVTTQLVVSAFGAGVALKGISDSAGSPKSNKPSHS